MAQRSGFDGVFLNDEGQPLIGLSIRVLDDEGNLAQIYDTKTGTSLKAQPVVTNSANSGLVQFWAEPGYYQVEVSDTEIPARISTRVVPFDAVAGDTAEGSEGISLSQLPIITESKIGTNAITRNKILNGEIIEDKLASNSVTRNKILNGEITESKLDTNSVSRNKIVNDAVNADKIAPQTIDTRTTSIALASTDVWKMILINSSNNLTVTVNADTGFAVGESVEIVRYGTGTVTLLESSPVNIEATPGLELRARFSGATLVCVGTNEYILLGDLK